MTERSDLANLRALGEPRIHDWAGASDPIGAGLVEWTRLAVSHDQALAVRAALDACALVTGEFRGSEAAGSRAYVDDMLAAIRGWLDAPTAEHREVVRSALDFTRQRHAWQADDDDAQFWIREAVDHACLTVWAQERASYIIPVDFATTAGRVIACVFHALRTSGHGEQRAADAVIDVVLHVTA
ncbi:MAG TPA: hypothetical protein VFK02_11365 [Kofleriaceae bacterium]|nr:hypothetical protein [Kofleriaceae bacterium]